MLRPAPTVVLAFILCLVIVSTEVNVAAVPAVYLSLGSRNITINNTQILITAIGEDVDGVPRLTCHTDLVTCCRRIDSGVTGGVGQWYYPDWRAVPNKAAGEDFYRDRNASQVVRLTHRHSSNPLRPTGSYCCVLPTTGGEMTFCANVVLKIDCGSLTSLANGKVLTPSGTTFMNNATYSCNTGYTLNGKVNRTCGVDGYWTHDEPVCEPIRCLALTLPMDGHISIMYSESEQNGTHPLGTVATYVCSQHGFGVRGDQNRTCVANNTGSTGQFNGSEPTCERIFCPSLGMIEHGSISYLFSNSTDPDSHRYGATSRYMCDNGFELSTSEDPLVRYCVGDNSSTVGYWSGVDGICVDIDECLTKIGNTCDQDCMNTVGSYNCSCKTGYRFAEDTSTCVDIDECSAMTHDCTQVCNNTDGSYNCSCRSGYLLEGDGRTCQRVNCNSPPVVSNGSPKTPNDTTFEAVVIYSCREGYTLNGAAIVTCLDSGNWSTPPTCEGMTCPRAPLPELGLNGTITYSSNTSPPYDFGTRATYQIKCAEGFERNGGDDVRTCVGDGNSPIGIWNGTAPVCSAQSVYLKLGETYYYTNNSFITITDIGSTDGNSLECHTNSTDCCSGMDNDGMEPLGDWFLSDGTKVFKNSEAKNMNILNDVFVRAGGSQVVKLLRKGDVLSPLGTFCCKVPFTSDESNLKTFCANLGTTPTTAENTPTTAGITPTTTGTTPTTAGITPTTAGTTPTTAGTTPTTAGTNVTIPNVTTSTIMTPTTVITSGPTTETTSTPKSTSSMISTTVPPQDIKCPAQPVPINGKDPIMYSEPGQESYTYPLGTVATYTCSPGFSLRGDQNRTCVNNSTGTTGRFNGSEPTCDDIDECTTTTHGCNQVCTNTGGSFHCDCWSGYLLDQDGDGKTCNPIDCMSPPSISHGPFKDVSNTTLGAVVTYSCDEGYRLDGSNVTCLASGNWSTPPTCEVVSCGSPPTLMNGSSGSLTNTTFRGTVTYSCDEGFVLSGLSVLSCMANGNWSSLPNCTDITCLSLPDHDYGNITYSPDTSPPFDFGTRATYQTVCPEGSERNGGDDMRTCGGDGSSPNGTWNGTAPVCSGQSVYLSLKGTTYFTNNSDIVITHIGFSDGNTLVCHTDQVKCCTADDVGSSSNGVGEWISPDGSNVIDNLSDLTMSNIFVRGRGSQFIYLARKGDVMSPLGKYCCRIPDRNSMNRTVCASLVAIRCVELAITGDGLNVTYSNTRENNTLILGTVATYTCSPGFSLRGDQNRTCVDNSTGATGQFNGSDPTCERISCSDLSDIRNGSIVYNSSNPTEPHVYGTTAAYECIQGFELSTGDNHRTCTGNSTSLTGHWSGDALTCTDIDECAIMTYYCTQVCNNTDGSFNCSCQSGYLLEGDGRTCSRVNCNQPPPVSNGIFNTSTTTTFEDVVTYVCDNGYRLNGSANVTCMASGNWSTPPTCDAVDCGLVPSVYNGSIVPESASTTFGSTVTYSCDNGFVLLGLFTVTCMANGNWSTLPNCTGITCLPLPELRLNGTITYSPDTSSPFDFGTKAFYETNCAESFERNGGDDVRTCVGDGNSPNGAWNGTAPVCSAQSVYLKLGETYYYTDNSVITITDIGSTDGNSLECHTNSTDCCSGTDNDGMEPLGDWFLPDGTKVFKNSEAKNMNILNDVFVRAGGSQVVKLLRKGDVLSPLGTFCCKVPFTSDIKKLTTFCAVLTATRCPTLMIDLPDDGLINVTYSNSLENNSYIFGTVATFTCSSGFGLSSTQGRMCVEGTTGDNTEGMFNGSNPTCEPITCSAPPDLARGMIMFSSNSTPFGFGATAQYQCHPGYTITQANDVRTCVGDESSPNGTWNGTAPTCTDVDECTSMTHNCTQICNNTVGSFNCSCRSGYLLIDDGRTCRPVDCNTPPKVSNGTHGTFTSTTFQAMVTYTCNNGYRLNGSANVTCLASGNWSTPPTCDAVSCGSPPLISNGSPGTPTRTTFEGTVTYSCNNGYTLSGSATVTCLASGSWSTRPTCRGVQIQGGSATLTVGETATLSCIPDVMAEELTWLKDNRLISQGNNIISLNVTFNPVNDSLHGANFSCMATFPDIQPHAFSNVTINVQVPSDAINTTILPSELNSQVGEMHSLTCSVSKLIDGLTGTTTVYWFNMNGRLDNGNGISKTMSASGNSTLRFSPLKTSHAGSYLCSGSITSPAKTTPLVYNQTQNITIKLPSPGLTLAKTPPTLRLFAGVSKLTFTCQVSMSASIDTDVEVNVTWTQHFHGQSQTVTTEEHTRLNGSTGMTLGMFHVTLTNLTSKDKSMSCAAIISPVNTDFITASGRANKEHSEISVSGVFLRQNGTILEDEDVSISNIGSNEYDTVQCYSDREGFFNGGWRFPNGSSVPEGEGRSSVVVTRQNRYLELKRVDNMTSPDGRYCCDAQDNRGMNQTVCITVAVLEQSRPVNDMVGVVVAVFVILILVVVSVVIIALVVRFRMRIKHTYTITSRRVKRKDLYAVTVEPSSLGVPLDDQTDLPDVSLKEQMAVTSFVEEDSEKKTECGNAEAAPSHSLSVSEFPALVESMHTDASKQFETEYTSISKEPLSSHDSSFLLVNRSKNRFYNVFPYDFNRITLKMVHCVEGSDYINASYVNGYMTNSKYIAAQGPLPNTLDDFWRMIWELKIPTIVMLTKCIEDRKKCECYWPQNNGDFIEPGYGITVTLMNQVSYADFTVRKMRLHCSKKADSTPIEVTQFHYTSWPDHGVPDSGMSLVYFTRVVRKAHPLDDPRHLLVHCSAGVGRTGTFIVLDTMLERIDQDDDINIYDCVTHIRKQRVLLVQTLSQYIFLFDALKELIVCGDTEILAHNLRVVVEHLNEAPRNEAADGASVDWQDNLTGFQRQFKVLEQFTSLDGSEDYYCAQNEENDCKNRYPAIIPNEKYRVKMASSPGSNYINASFIDGYQQSRAYIATQGPLEHTTGDFWRMVVENQCSCVVMLCTLVEGDEPASHRYWPKLKGTKELFGDYIVSQQSFETCGGYVVRTLEVSEKSSHTKAVAPFVVTQFHLTHWTEKEHPRNSTSLQSLIQDVNRIQMSTENKPIVVMCNNGIGRTGVFITIHAQLERLKIEGVADIFQFIKSARAQREGLVNSPDLYAYCHEALADYVDSFETYANFKELV